MRSTIHVKLHGVEFHSADDTTKTVVLSLPMEQLTHTDIATVERLFPQLHNTVFSLLQAEAVLKSLRNPALAIPHS